MKFRIAILASGDGTNAEAIIKHFKENRIATVVLVLSNRPDAGVLRRAQEHGVASRVFTREQFQGEIVLGWLNELKVTHVVLAGFLWLIPPGLLKAFPGRIINIHPALLPKFGGKGMYGKKVHEAVLAQGEKETGITIHLVNEKFDEGRILFQERCSIEPGDTAESIAAKVQRLEHEHFPGVIERWLRFRIPEA